ncbi:MAG: hypothetical protein JRJ10_14840 [Deltaproteobacteria bacterium]|nr:hypothetical protein [Deltaproteobacteria bacterium]
MQRRLYHGVLWATQRVIGLGLVKQGESATERFEAFLEDVRPPTGGVAYAELAAEVSPLLPLLGELPVDERTRGDYESFGFRECFAVLTLLGRRLALLDLTPTAAIQVVVLAVRSIERPQETFSREFAQRAVEASMEGFVLGREERSAQTAEARAAKPLRPLRIGDAVFALILSGVHEPAVLSECVDALGRAMLNSDVEMAVVDVTQIGDPNRERATAIFAADEITRMLGGVCVFTGVDARWRAAAADARIPLDELQIALDLRGAVAAAQAMAAGANDMAKPTWRALLDRLRR